MAEVFEKWKWFESEIGSGMEVGYVEVGHTKAPQLFLQAIRIPELGLHLGIGTVGIGFEIHLFHILLCADLIDRILEQT